MRTALAVFDMAGTTVLDENNVAEAFQKAFALNQISIERELVTPLMGYHKPEAIQMVLEQTGHSFDADFIEEIHEDFESEMMEFYAGGKSVRPQPGAEEIFAWLKSKGIKIALNTGFSAAIADVIISRFQWEERGLVDEFIGSDEVEKGRPYPYMIYELMKRCGIKQVSEVAKIGDTIVDIEEGRQAGCSLIIAVTTGACSGAELIRANPTHIINHLAQLKSIF